MKKTAIELFAGVGGFRVGLNNIKGFDKNGHAVEKGPWKFVWSNQWEPSTKTQHAFDCYNLRFAGNDNSNMDISKVNKKDIPDHYSTLIKLLLFHNNAVCVLCYNSVHHSMI